MKYEYWFANIKGISNRRKVEIREKFSVIKELYCLDEEKMGAYGIKENEKKLIVESIKSWQLEQEYKKVNEKEVRCVPFHHWDYPKKLKYISSPPYMLYLRGRMPDPNKKTIAIVGARECSPYGERMAREFAEALALHDVQIVSGMARGIDSASQRGALDVGGTSFGILGCGVDLCYPREEIGLYQELIARGGVISEYPINTSPLRQNFPVRNLIIIGMADAILVMEAKEKSGSLITADMALDQGKDVYALPGPVNSMLSRGCHSLIKQGAEILISTEELLQDLGVKLCNIAKKSDSEKILLELSENLVYGGLDLQPQSLDELIRKTGLSVPDVLNELVRLEMMGVVKEISKNNYVKLK